MGDRKHIRQIEDKEEIDKLNHIDNHVIVCLASRHRFFTVIEDLTIHT